MILLITGESVTVHYRVEGEPDPFGNPEITWRDEGVDNVLVSPGRRTDLDDGDRPDGVVVALTLHFPKSFSNDLELCEVTARGKRFRVIGKPMPYTLSNTPTDWHMPCELEAIDG